MAKQLLEIRTIKKDPIMQPRECLNDDLVNEYTELFKPGCDCEPIGVVSDGTTNWVWDGFHRLAAYEANGRPFISCLITEGTKLDALRLSLGANARHGLRRTNADKRRAVIRALNEPEFAKLNLQGIADMCAVTARFVKTVQDELCTVQSSKSRPAKKIGKDGKQRPTKYNTKPKVTGVVNRDEPVSVEDHTPTRRIDEEGNELPGSLCVVFDSVNDFVEADHHIESALRWLNKVEGSPPAGWLVTIKSTAQRLREARQDIKGACPHCVCPKCNGRGCNHCGDRGWMPKKILAAYERLTETSSPY